MARFVTTAMLPIIIFIDHRILAISHILSDHVYSDALNQKHQVSGNGGDAGTLLCRLCLRWHCLPREKMLFVFN